MLGTSALWLVLTLGMGGAWGCPRQVALKAALESEKTLLAELRSDLATLPKSSEHLRPGLRGRVRDARDRVEELSRQLRQQKTRELLAQQAEQREMDLGYRAEDLIESRGWLLRDFRWEARHAAQIAKLDPAFAKQLQVKRREQVLDYARQLVENKTPLRTQGQVLLIREAAKHLKESGTSGDRARAREFLRRATREEHRLQAEHDGLPLEVPEEVGHERSWLQSDVGRMGREFGIREVQGGLDQFAQLLSKSQGPPPGSVALTGVYRGMHSWQQDGLTVVYRYESPGRARVFWIGTGTVDLRVVDGRLGQ